MARRVLIIRLGAMGDVCMTVPVAAALQEHCQVDWLIRRAYAAIPRLFPRVSCRLIPVAPGERFSDALADELRKANYDAVLDFSHWPSVAGLVRRLTQVPIRGVTHDPEQDRLLRIDAGADRAAFNRVVPVAPGLHQVDKWRCLIADTLGLDVHLAWPLPKSTAANRPLRIFLHPHASKPSKHWPGHRFAEVLRALAQHRPIECAINSGSKKELPAALAVWMRLRCSGIPARIVWLERTYQRLRAALAQADVALGCDSGPMHLASLLGVPTVVIYGPYPASEFAPLWRSTPVSPPRPGQSAFHVSSPRVRAALFEVTGTAVPSAPLLRRSA